MHYFINFTLRVVITFYFRATQVYLITTFILDLAQCHYKPFMLSIFLHNSNNSALYSHFLFTKNQHKHTILSLFLQGSNISLLCSPLFLQRVNWMQMPISQFLIQIFMIMGEGFHCICLSVISIDCF